jgi:hypothetical protein
VEIRHSGELSAVASQLNNIDADDLNDIGLKDEIPGIMGDLNNALDRIDRLGLTEAGAMLARVLDCLALLVSDSPENGRAIRS